ncbi:MAG: hypothetical protein NT080_13955 [Spirochaetes bacterium]|nr:hypothetical protein [Spirochaetota bacterium]
MRRGCLFGVMFMFLALSAVGAQYRYDIDEPLAQEAFRLGVQAYHRARYAEALALFEKAFSAEQGSPLAAYWLGRTYLKNGLESIALERFDAAATLGGPSVLVENRAAGIRAGRAIDVAEQDDRHVRIASIESGRGSSTSFGRPSAVMAEKDGSVLVTAFGSNEILRIDTNGLIKTRFKGGTTGFEGPFAIVRTSDGYWVSEFRGDRIAKLDFAGNVVRRIAGAKGVQRLSGPQHLAIDESEYLYVVDFGNSRVVRFHPDGTMIQQFGQSGPGFAGLKMPTGIAARDGRVYVADLALRAIAVFDYSGNYLETIGEGAFSAPEGISFDNDRILLVADREKVVTVNLETMAVTELYRPERKKPRITDVARDAAGDIVLVDIDANAIEYLSDQASLYAGFTVDLERIDPSRFPLVEMDVIVRDRLGRPVVGLDARNFYATERIRKGEEVEENGTTLVETVETIVPVSQLEVTESGSVSSDTSIAIIVEGSRELAEARDEVARTLDALGRAGASRGTVALIAAGTAASPLASNAADLPRSIVDLLAIPASPAWRLDQAARLAVNGLVQRKGRGAIIFVTSGSVNEATLGSSSLADLASYCRNNGIAFHAVLAGKGRASDALRYLVGSTGGSIYDAGRAEGFSNIIRGISETELGRYRMRFRSASSSGFGRVYQSVAVEAYLFKKSGKDELGYFAPLD